LRVHTHYAPVRDERDRVLSAIRSILSDATALQRFRLTNCPDGHEPHPPGRWTQFDSAAGDIEADFSRTENIKPEPPACSVTQMLLENFATLSTDDGISRDILNAKVTVTEKNRIPVREILKRVEKDQDVDMISWYQNSVLTTIMKIVCSRLMKIVRESSVRSTEISRCADLINQTNTTVSGIACLPACLVNGFTILNRALKIDRIKIAELSNYHASLSGIELGEIATSATNVKNEIKYLEKMFHMISHNINDLQCVRQYFKCLYDEHDRYHVPFVEDENNFKPVFWADEMRSSEDLCHFVTNIYSMCHKCLLLSDLCTNNEKSTDKTNNCQKAWTLIDTVKRYFLVVIKNETDDLGLLQMSYNIAMVLVNLQQPSKNSNNIFGLQKTLEVIMSQLYSSNLKYCTSQSSNLLLFHNIKFMELKNDDFIQQSIHAFLEKNLKYFKPASIGDLDVQPSYNNFMSVAFLYSRCIEHSEFFKKYENNIRIYWEGTLKTVKNIFKEFLLFSLNPKNVYAFYDIYFKFTITAVYYEIINILDTYQNDQNFINVMFGKVSKILTHFEYMNFPKELKQFILNIKTLYDIQLPLEGESSIIDRRNINRQIIDEQLGAFNIVLTKSSSNLWTKICSVCGSTDGKIIESLIIINKEHQHQVEYVRYYFLMIEKHRINENR